ncbi:hypothetical protein [Robbsia andropogonis]|uniref:hypothetical protein n=1 Tax=Robbsia andropogonis TaxID=28092 RepID=UPI00069659A9|nr:hypothetical protein [Robbsia andropogonis]
MELTIDDSNIGVAPGGGEGESLRHRVAMHPTLGIKCRFDAQGRAYAEIAGKRIGSLTSEIWEIPGPLPDAGGSTAREKGALAPHPTGISRIAQRAYHGAMGPAAARPILSSRPSSLMNDVATQALPGVLDDLDDSSLIDADRILRAVHAVNFFSAGQSSLLFLPVHDRLLKSIRYDHGKHFAQLLVSLGLSPARVVIEIPPASSAHKTFLAYLLRSYRSYGFKVAAYLEDAGKVLSIDSSAMPDFVVAHAATALRDGVVRPLVRFGGMTRVRIVFAAVANDDERDRLTAMGATYIENRL